MKKILFFVLASAMLLSCVACSAKNVPEKPAETTVTTPATTTEEPTTPATTTEEPTTPATTTEEPTTPATTTEEPTTPATTTEEPTTPATTTEEPTTPETTTEEPTAPETPAESTEPTERPKPEIKVVTIDEYMKEKYGEYEFVRTEPWFEMYRVNGVSVFVYKHEELEYGANLEQVYDYMFTYNWADNGYYQMNADSIEKYYEELMKPYLTGVGDYAVKAWLEQAVQPSELEIRTPYKDALKEYGEFLFPEVFVLVKASLTDAQKTEIIDKLTTDGVKVHLHIGVAHAVDFELNRTYIITEPEKYSNQMDVKINWNGDMYVIPEGGNN